MTSTGVADTLSTTPAVTDRALGVIMIIAGTLGEAAAFVLAVEKYWLLTNPFYRPSCSVNAVLSCSPVMNSDQSSVFGFPNPYLGILGFGIVLTTGVVLVGRAELPRWFWSGLQVGTTLGALFVCWLIVQSVFFIKALCPYCMVVWVVVFTVHWYVSLRNTWQVRDGLPPGPRRMMQAAQQNHSALLVGWLVLVAAVVALGVILG